MQTLQLMLLGAGLLLAPLFGGLVSGIDRRLTARLQSRVGPPLLQPFYDAGKLLGKTPMVGNPWLAFCAVAYLLCAMVAMLLFVLQSDLLLIFFVQTAGAVLVAIGALSTPSPYSQIGGQRELLQMLAYEPLFLLVIIGIALKTGSFMLSEIWTLPAPLLRDLPLLFLALGIVLTIKLRKSPFDISASHHAHQELVRGVYTEYSGPLLALIEIGHWYEVALLLGLCAMFWATNPFGMILLVLVTYFLEIVIDNATARLTWRKMLASALIGGVGISLLNLIWLRTG